MGSNWMGSEPSQRAAEILPPEGRAYEGEAGPPRPRPSRGSRWASAPATYTLVGINCAVFIAMVVRGVSPSNPSVQELVNWGANFGGYVLAGDEKRPDVVLVYLKGSKDLIAGRMAARKGHFMPPSLLDSQFATLEEPAADEHPIVVSIEPPPDEIVDDAMKKLKERMG